MKPRLREHGWWCSLLWVRLWSEPLHTQAGDPPDLSMTCGKSPEPGTGGQDSESISAPGWGLPECPRFEERDFVSWFLGHKVNKSRAKVFILILVTFSLIHTPEIISFDVVTRTFLQTIHPHLSKDQYEFNTKERFYEFRREMDEKLVSLWFVFFLLVFFNLCLWPSCSVSVPLFLFLFLCSSVLTH